MTKKKPHVKTDKGGWHKIGEESYARTLQRVRSPVRRGGFTSRTPKPCPTCYAPLNETNEKGVFICDGKFKQHVVRV